MTMERRTFIQLAGTAALAAQLPVRRASSAEGKVVVGLVGLNGRGGALAKSFGTAQNAEIGFVCDVDERAIAKMTEELGKIQKGRTPKGVKDFRTLLDSKEVDALAFALPDHWHTPAAVLAMKAGKHVYVEKPGSHNPREGELLAAVQKKTGKVAQLGTQQRSDPQTLEAMALLRQGIIGKPYFAKAWYANVRKPIGKGNTGPIPEWLDYELWQGPAPRRPYKDNLIHYNWHWIKHYGTGEACNNGTHEIDVCRWALDVGYPTRVMSSGGRLHHQDDWEFPDTQTISCDFEGGKSISWEGRSCNGMKLFGRGRGSLIHGTEGTMLIDRDGYIVYDPKGDKEIKKNVKAEKRDALNTVGGEPMTDIHVANFIEAIRSGKPLAQPVAEGQKSVLLCHLGNIAQQVGQSLNINPNTGKIIGNSAADRLWGRKYQRGWEPKV
jgi:predicted dehydrogenase